MAAKFKWESDENATWDRQPVAAKTAESRRPFPWLTFLLIMATLAIAGLVIYRQVQQRVAAATMAVETDVLTSHRLVRQAAATSDKELGLTLLSGRDAAWLEAQAQLIENGLLFNPKPFDLEATTSFPSPLLAPREPAVEPITITLEPDLTTAELQFEQTYQVQRNYLTTETVTLRQTAVYRRGDARWLLAPPERAFWGEWLTYSGGRLMVAYPARDRDIAERLARDLEVTLDSLCRELADLHCPADLQVQLRLDATPESLIQAADFATVISSGRQLELPTPTLVGLPLDEPGYQALYRGYAIHLVSAVVTDLVGYECCQHELLYQALLDKQLAQLGLRPWPLTAAVYDELLGVASENLAFHFLNVNLNSRAQQNWLHVYALADFLVTEGMPETSIAEIQRQLGSDSRYDIWRQLVPQAADSRVFASQMLQFAYRQSASARIEPPIPLPDQTVQLICSSSEGESLYQYNFQTAEWTRRFHKQQVSNAYSAILTLPDGSGYLFQTQDQLILHRDEVETVVYEQAARTALSRGFSVSSFDPTGRYIVLTIYDDSNESTAYENRLLDLQACGPDSCPLRPIPGWLIWSPDGSQTLIPIRTPEQAGNPIDNNWWTQLQRGDMTGGRRVTIGVGGWPTWLEDNYYAYTRLGEEYAENEWDMEVVTASTADDTAHVLLRSSDLLAALPATKRPSQLLPLGVQLQSGYENRLVVFAVNYQFSPPIYYFSVEADTTWSQVKHISFLFDHDAWSNLSFSPDGRWLAALVYAGGTTISLLNLETGEIEDTFHFRGFTELSWSADGQWLLFSQDRELRLMAPAYGYERPIFHDLWPCRGLRLE